MKSNIKFKATIALLVMAIIWGASYLGVEAAVIDGWGPYSILFIRCSIATIALLPFALKEKKKNDKGIFLGGALCGLSAFIGLILQTYGQKITTIACTSFITSLYIVFVPILMGIFYKKKQPLNVLFALVLSILGAFFLNLDSSFSIDLGNINGNLFVLAGSIFFAIQILLIAKYTQKYGVLKLTCIECTFMALYALIGMFIANDFTIEASSSLIYVGIVGLLSSGLCSVLQMYGNKHLDPTIAGIIMGLESVFGAIFGLLVYNESMSYIKVIGCALIFIGAIISQIDFKKKKVNK